MANGNDDDRIRIELRGTDPDQTVYDLLERNGLPTGDLDTANVQLFRGTMEGKFVGIGGYEQYETDALLRSVVVQPEERAQGYGTEICLELEDKIAASLGTAIYLLTTDASGFFEQLGYEQIERDAAPDTIQSTREFSDLCPSTAVCMMKTI